VQSWRRRRRLIGAGCCGVRGAGRGGR